MLQMSGECLDAHDGRQRLLFKTKEMGTASGGRGGRGGPFTLTSYLRAWGGGEGLGGDTLGPLLFSIQEYCLIVHTTVSNLKYYGKCHIFTYIYK